MDKKETDKQIQELERIDNNINVCQTGIHPNMDTERLAHILTGEKK